jgi:uncharacterized protein YutE (UPF0331/DUF86 family)
MTDLELAAKKMSEIESFLGELRALARLELIAVDLRERRFVEHTLQLAIQAALDLASHIVSDERLGEPETYGELFSLLAGRGFIPADLAPRLRRMAGFRNLIVHGYAKVDPAIVAAIASRDVHDLLEFVSVTRHALGLPAPDPSSTP